MRENCMYRDICENECSQSCVRFLETDYLLEHSYIPKSKRKVNKLIAPNVDRKAFEELAWIRNNIEEFVKNGECLYIYSKNCGNGKTTWAIKMLLQFFNCIWAGNGFKARGLFLSVPNYLAMCKDFNNQKAMSEVSKIRNSISELDLVVFDDVATANMISDFDNTNLLVAINNRMLEDKAMIFTGNIVPKDLNKYVGDRLASRICSGTLIELKGKDNR